MTDGDWVNIRDLVKRLEAIEARQRASSQHDPGCYSFDLVPLRDDDSVGFGPCDCWLSEEP